MAETETLEFSPDTDDDDDDLEPLPAWQKNYLTPGGMERLQDALNTPRSGERPKVVEVVPQGRDSFKSSSI